MPRNIFLSLGSNLGEREHNLEQAIAAIAGFATVVNKSSIYESKAWGLTDQPDFLNMALEVSTDLSPQDFLSKLQSVEQSLGRQRRHKWGPREIDLDIVFWDNAILNLPDLIIPHPYWRERAFVVIPLAEIAPHFVPPGESVSLASLVAESSIPFQHEITKKPPDKSAKI